MDVDSTIERSFSPGIREYTPRRRRSFSSRPIGCFAIIGCCLLVAGIGMVLWEARSRPKLELSNWYAIMRTLGTTFVSLGLFVFLVSTILMCETVLSERSANRRLHSDEESNNLHDDIQSSQDYGNRWETPRQDEFFSQKSVNETLERKTRGIVRCVSDSHFARRSNSRVTRDSSSGEFRYDGRSAAGTQPSSPTYSTKSTSYNWAPVYDRPTPSVHKKGKHRKKLLKNRSRGASESWASSSDHYADLEKIHKPRLRVSVSEEAIEDNSSTDSPDSGRPKSEFSVNSRSNAELLNLLVEKGIVTVEDFRHYFKQCVQAGKSSPNDSKHIHYELNNDVAVAGHSRPVLLRQRNIEHIHNNTPPSRTFPKRSENGEITSERTPPITASLARSLDRNGPPSRVLFTIGERTRTSSNSDWRTESDAGQLDSTITTSVNLGSQLSSSLPHLHGQSETIVDDLQAFENASGPIAFYSENVNPTHQQHFNNIKELDGTSENNLQFEHSKNELVHEENSSVVEESTSDSTPLVIQ